MLIERANGLPWRFPMKTIRPLDEHALTHEHPRRSSRNHSHKVLLNPSCELFAPKFTARDREHDHLLLVYGGGQFIAVQEEDCFECCVPDPFVAVDEDMILNEEIPERRGLLSKSRIQLVIRERLKWLQHRGFEAAAI